jgi:hypothetical protein
MLNDKSIGRVVKINPDAPLRPVVRVILDENRNRLGETKLVDLKMVPGVFIAKAVKAAEPRQENEQ